MAIISFDPPNPKYHTLVLTHLLQCADHFILELFDLGAGGRFALHLLGRRRGLAGGGLLGWSVLWSEF